jgi:hypothetical protein
MSLEVLRGANRLGKSEVLTLAHVAVLRTPLRFVTESADCIVIIVYIHMLIAHT